MKAIHNGITIEGTPQEILEYQRLREEKNKTLAQKTPQEIEGYMDRIYGYRSLPTELIPQWHPSSSDPANPNSVTRSQLRLSQNSAPKRPSWNY